MNNLTPTTRIHFPNEPLNVPHHVTFATDPDGLYVVGVRLANASDKTVWLCAMDYEVLIRKYLPVEWLLLRKSDSDRPYVGFYVASGKRRIISVLRAMLGDYAGPVPGCLDGDHLNLRRRNTTLFIN